MTDHNPYVGNQHTVFEQGWKRGRKDLLPIILALYGGVESMPEDDDPMWVPKALRSIAAWLDRVDDATDKAISSLGGQVTVNRAIQASLREIAEDLDD